VCAILFDQEGREKMEEKRVRRSIIFPESLYEKAKKQADKEFRQISGIVVAAVEKYLEEKEREKK
jgi:metal-responsive CopG/Arc/MetJ family transcriptional regulator